VAHPLHRDSLFCRVEVRDQAVSTSGSSENFFLSDGRRYSHIFDPRTGRPVFGGLLSVTVVAPAGMASDALSSAAFVMGPEEGMALIEGAKGVGALFVSEAPGRPTGLDVRVSSRLKGQIF
jgi:thiamine biosynthesis lipoprotein